MGASGFCWGNSNDLDLKLVSAKKIVEEELEETEKGELDVSLTRDLKKAYYNADSSSSDSSASSSQPEDSGEPASSASSETAFGLFRRFWVFRSCLGLFPGERRFSVSLFPGGGFRRHLPPSRQRAASPRLLPPSPRRAGNRGCPPENPRKNQGNGQKKSFLAGWKRPKYLKTYLLS